MRSSLPYDASAVCAAAISNTTKSDCSPGTTAATGNVPPRSFSESLLRTPVAGQILRDCNAVFGILDSLPAPVSGFPRTSTPYSGTEPAPSISTCLSMTGEKRALTGNAVSFAIQFSSIPPLARISRSVFPSTVTRDDWNDPVAASPARSIATTTATPSATASTVSEVRSRSRRSGRNISVRKSFINSHAAVAQTDPRAGDRGCLGAMSCHEDRGAEFLGAAADQCKHLVPAGGVEVSRRFIGNQDLGRLHQRPGDGNSLHLAAGKLVGQG